MTKENHVIVLGATSLIGRHLLRRLADAGCTGEATGRNRAAQPLPAGFAWRVLDPAAPGDWRTPEQSAVFSLLPLAALPSLLPRLRAARQIVALSTTSLFYKTESPDPAERAAMAVLESAERALQDLGPAWTLLRPTLVYDPGHDINVSAVARVIRRVGFFPVAAPARGLRQPVHADDVAQAMLAALDNPRASNVAITLPGSETLSYRDMVARIFEGLGRRPRIVPLPGGLLAGGLALARALTGSSYSPALFQRMNQDLVFDGADAERILNFAPRPFHPEFQNRGGDAP